LNARADAGAPSFVFHDGPPYTNSAIHLGTAMNKLLKDFAVRTRGLMGYRAPFVPGYDNHGLPIEQAVLKKFNDKKIKPTLLELRKACREHAEHYIGVQTEQFSRLGIIATWDNPYTSMGFRYEAEIIRVFKRMVEGGYVYRGLRSVLWSPTSRTALADTETLYHDHTSTSIYVAFPLMTDPEGVFKGLENVSCVIWTTTPWTIPANVAVAFHPRFTYDVVKVGDRHLVMLHELVEKTLEKCGLQGETVRQLTGQQVENALFKHPIFNRESRAVLADYVTTEDGTGIVHTAP
ncbi:MAG: class I tRNA ligase family protein, partial [Armatimonadota bacterium]